MKTIFKNLRIIDYQMAILCGQISKKNLQYYFPIKTTLIINLMAMKEVTGVRNKPKK